MTRRGCVCALALGVFFTGRPALAQRDETRRACGAAFEKGQELRQSGRLAEARAELIRCADSACPDFIQRDCNRWVSEVESDQPSVVVTARDRQGADVEVRVLSDDKLASEGVGSAIPLDPGEHVLHLEAPGFVPATQRLLLRVGEKKRSVVVTMDLAPERAVLPPPLAIVRAAGPPKIRVASYVFFGLGAASLGAFGVLAGDGFVREKAISCAPNCPDDVISPIRKEYLAADVTLGIAVGSAVLGSILFLLSSPKISRQPSALGFSLGAHELSAH